MQTIPNLHPDIIAKLAFDPVSQVHFEIAGIERTFKDWNPNTNVYFTKVGGGGSFNGNFEIAKNFRLITNNYWSDGGGRYLFGQAPDLMVRSDGSISPIHAGGTIQGFEATAGKTLLYAYWSGVYIGKQCGSDANGTSLVGYGYHGSANSQNRDSGNHVRLQPDHLEEPNWGAVNVMGQYRGPSATLGMWPPTPPKRRMTTLFINLRYTLPGSAPK